MLVLLAVPRVVNVLKDTKKRSFAIEAENIIKAGKNAYSNRELEGQERKTCYTLEELADYVDKNFSDYEGSIQIDPTNNIYKIWISKEKMIINGSASGNMQVTELQDNNISASSSCRDLIIQACYNSLTGKLLILDLNGGSWNGYNSTQVFPMEENDTAEIFDPEKEDYIFTGWQFNGDNGSFDDETNTFTMGTDNVIMEATWELDKRNLLIVLDNGTISRSLSEAIKPGLTTNVPAPTKTGYNFVRWTVSEATSSIDGTTFTMGTEDTTLTAVWEKIPKCELDITNNILKINSMNDAPLAVDAYSFTSGSSGFSSTSTTNATDTSTYQGWIKTHEGFVGTCELTCTAWSTTPTTNNTCDPVLNKESKIECLSSCTYAFTCNSGYALTNNNCVKSHEQRYQKAYICAHCASRCPGTCYGGCVYDAAFGDRATQCAWWEVVVDDSYVATCSNGGTLDSTTCTLNDQATCASPYAHNTYNVHSSTRTCTSTQEE